MKYLIIPAVLLLIFGIYLFLALPTAKKRRIKKYAGQNFAHRGLHGGKVVENSMEAFRRAVDAGYGIELDVWKTSDGELIVMHDFDTVRICGVSKDVTRTEYSELKELKLGETDECIPKLSEVLELVDGRVPLLIELKSKFSETELAEPFVRFIEGYKGDYIVESFNPMLLAKIRKLNKDIPLGILASDFKDQNAKGSKKLMFFALKNMLLNFLSRPDFISYGITKKDPVTLKLCKALCKATVFRWTAKGKPGSGDGVIFELE